MGYSDYDGILMIDDLPELVVNDNLFTKIVSTKSVTIDCQNNAELIEVITGDVLESINATGCSLTAASIEDILRKASLNVNTGYLVFTGGNNAPISQWSAQAIAYKNTIMNEIGGVVEYNS